MSQYIEIYITQVSKYFITLFVALYCIECLFAVLKKPEKRVGTYRRQKFLMLLVHFVCFLSICFETGDTDYLVFYVFQQVLLIAIGLLFGLIYPDGDRLLVNNMCMLLTVGFVILTRLSFDRAIKQFFIVAISVVLTIGLPYFFRKAAFLKKCTWVYAITGLAAIGVVLVLGSMVNGSKISYSVGGITFQPSEFVKILFVLFLAGLLSQGSDFLHIMMSAVIAGGHVLILVASKDLGSALIFFVIYVSMVFVATRNPIYLLFGVTGGMGAAMLAYKLFRHVQVRYQAWKDPWSVIDNAGYQISKSLFAISSGGIWGLGLFQGTPESIPYVEADFIFSAIAEEMGIAFAMFLLVICLSSFIQFILLSLRIQDKFYRLTAFGIGMTYIFQVFLTVGGGSKFIPMTGVTLPFVSYGGSSVLTSLILFLIGEGVVLVGIDEERRQESEPEHPKRRGPAKQPEQTGRRKDNHTSKERGTGPEPFARRKNAEGKAREYYGTDASFGDGSRWVSGTDGDDALFDPERDFVPYHRGDRYAGKRRRTHHTNAEFDDRYEYREDAPVEFFGDDSDDYREESEAVRSDYLEDELVYDYDEDDEDDDES